MIVELAVLTGIPPAAWRQESEATIATALDILAARKGTRNG